MNKQKPPRMNEEMLDLDFMVNSKGRIFSKYVQYAYHTIYLSDKVGDAAEYHEEFQLFADAQQGVVVEIVLNNFGGSLETAVQFYERIRNSEAKVVASIEGVCHSAASVIALACDEWKVSPFASMLVHNASYAIGGAAHEVESHVEHSKKHLDFCLKKIYSGFLTQAEVKRVIEGLQKYLTAEEVINRLEKYANHRAKSEATETVSEAISED